MEEMKNEIKYSNNDKLGLMDGGKEWREEREREENKESRETKLR